MGAAMREAEHMPATDQTRKAHRRKEFAPFYTAALQGLLAGRSQFDALDEKEAIDTAFRIAKAAYVKFRKETV